MCRYREIEETHPLVEWFWEILESFTNEERILFMRFVSGRSRLPMNASDITQRFQILKIDRVSFSLENVKVLCIFYCNVHMFGYEVVQTKGKQKT